MSMWTSFNAYVENEAITKVSPKNTEGRCIISLKIAQSCFGQ